MKRLSICFFSAAALAGIVAAAVLSCSSACSKKQNVRLLYWNIQNAMWADQGNNYDNFVKFVLEKDPDICVWAESKSHYNTASDISYDLADRGSQYLPDNWDELAERYGHKYVYVGGERDFFPQTITSKYPLHNVKRLLGDGKDSIVAHGAGWATVEIAGKKINIVTVHTWPQKYGLTPRTDEEKKESAARMEGDYYRRTEMEYICKHTIQTVPDAKDQYWMMMGDFNAKSSIDNWHYGWPTDTTAFLVHDYILQNTPYVDVIHELYPNEFHSSHLNGTRIDFVYLTEPLMKKVEHAEILHEGWSKPERVPWSKKRFCTPSDHEAIIVDFKL